MLKEKKGITLIALVITIIILIILAGIGLVAVLGEDGLISRAQKAKIDMMISQKEEEVQVAIMEEILENDGNSSLVTVSKVLFVTGLIVLITPAKSASIIS